MLKDKQKLASKKHYQQNKKRVIAKVREYKQRKRKEWWEYKGTLKCQKCGAAHPAIIDFHHIDKTDKTKQHVNALVKAGRFTAAYEEIKKCVVLCANCHRIHHYDEMISSRED